MAAIASVKRIAVEFPKPLLVRADRAGAEMSMNRSELIRRAVEHYLETLQRAKLEKDLAEGYVANAAQARIAAEELAVLDRDLP